MPSQNAPLFSRFFLCKLSFYQKKNMFTETHLLIFLNETYFQIISLYQRIPSLNLSFILTATVEKRSAMGCSLCLDLSDSASPLRRLSSQFSVCAFNLLLKVFDLTTRKNLVIHAYMLSRSNEQNQCSETLMIFFYNKKESRSWKHFYYY